MIFCNPYNMDEEDKYDTETSDVETEAGIRESPQVATIFINKQKIANPNKETAADTDSLLRYRDMEDNGMTNPTYVRACMTTFCPNFLCTNLSLRKVKKRKSVTYKLKYSTIDRNPFGNFNNLQMSRLLSNSLTNHSWSLDYIQQDLRWINLFCKLLSELLASSKTCHRGFDGSDRNCVFVRPRYGPRAWLV